jgi:hypothetical protein
MIKQLDKWHRTKSGLLVFCVAELLIAYSFAGLAIDRGNLWWYLLTLVFLAGSLQNFFKLIGNLLHHGKR